MIATILPSSTNFHAITYNEHKVNRGVASLIEMKDIYGIADFDPYNPEALRKYFMDYSARNDRIKKPQFHVAISCRGHEYTPEQLRVFAHVYLERMGYGSPGQPLVIYAHNDTDNTHIHIVTSRVAPDGHKIDHNHERRRSQKILNELMHLKPERQLIKDLAAAKEYDFETTGQFASILKASGYDVIISQKDNCIRIYKHGCSLNNVTLEDISSLAQRKKDQREQNMDGQRNKREKRKKYVRALMRKYHDLTLDKEDFCQNVKKQFGFDIVFHGSADTPYGFTVIDHSAKMVFAGKEIMGIKEMLDFPTLNDRCQLAQEIVSRCLMRDRYSTTQDINRALKRKVSGVYLQKGRLHIRQRSGEESQFLLPESLTQQIHNNNQMDYAAQYAPTTFEQRSILMSVFSNDFQGMFEDFIRKRYPDGIQPKNLRSREFIYILTGSLDKMRFRQSIRQQGFSLHKSKSGSYFIVDHKARTIVNADAIEPGLSHRIDLLQLQSPGMNRAGGSKQPATHHVGHIVPLPSGHNTGTHSESREWEVGTQREMDDPEIRPKI